MKRIYRWIFFLIGVAGVVILALEADITRTDWKDLFDEKLPLVLLMQILIWLVIYAVHTSVYRLILGPEVRDLSFLRLYKITITGLALNSVTPAGLIGGEPYRILELKHFCSTEKAMSSTLTFTVFYVMGHVFLWLTGTVLYFLFGCPGETGMTILLAAVGVILFLICFLFLKNPEKGFVLSFYRFFSCFPLLKKKLQNPDEKRKESLRRIDENIRSFNKKPEKFRTALFLEYFSRLLECLEYYVILRYLGENITLPGALLVMSMATLVGNLLFIIPMQAGTREGGMLIALDWLGTDSSAGIRTSILYRVRDLICISAGIVFILIGKKIQKEENAEG